MYGMGENPDEYNVFEMIKKKKDKTIGKTICCNSSWGHLASFFKKEGCPCNGRRSE